MTDKKLLVIAGSHKDFQVWLTRNRNWKERAHYVDSADDLTGRSSCYALVLDSHHLHPQSEEIGQQLFWLEQCHSVQIYTGRVSERCRVLAEA